MGRPIKKSKMAGSASGVAGNLAVTAYRPSGEAKVDSTTAYIVAQRGSRLFKISLEDSTTAVYCLKAVAPGSLSATPPNGADGEFCVQIILDDSSVAFVEKFYNNTAHYVVRTAGSQETQVGTTGSVKYSLGVEGTDMGGGDGTGEKDTRPNTGSIDVITDQ